MTSEASLETLAEQNDVAALDASAESCGFAEQRRTGSHAAVWHNIHLPQFSRICCLIWGGKVACLPNMAVYAAAQRHSKIAKGKVTISVKDAETPAGQTVYVVNGTLLFTVG